MRFGVEYEQNDGGMIGLLLFSADDMQAANNYIEDMCKKHGFTRVFNLKQITEGASVPELRRLFPGYLLQGSKREAKHTHYILAPPVVESTLDRHISCSIVHPVSQDLVTPQIPQGAIPTGSPSHQER